MNIDSVPFRTIWLADDVVSVGIIHQPTLPDMRGHRKDARYHRHGGEEPMRVVQPASSLGGEA